MAAFNELSTGVWQVTLTAREKGILEVVRAADAARFKALVEDFFTEQEQQLYRNKAKLLAAAYRNASAVTRQQIDSILGV